MQFLKYLMLFVVAMLVPCSQAAAFQSDDECMYGLMRCDACDALDSQASVLCAAGKGSAGCREAVAAAEECHERYDNECQWFIELCRLSLDTLPGASYGDP
ncbi:MAG: hypothetical protein KDD44_03185, partial [Bdellovibrionales bacterium]|nr:hypothetical protein [Bdellovibrionales bacterium]